MSLPNEHFQETKKLALALKNAEIAKWLLVNGYFPEPYVFPPTFSVVSFKLNEKPYIKISKGKVPEKEVLSLSFPKSSYTSRTFGIIHPHIYHDFVWYITKNWELLIEHIFNERSRIYSYSFPIPVSNINKGELSTIRTGRMIYEFLEMAETDLVAEAYKYKIILHTDVSNFYPSIYTHSIAWALHGKEHIRDGNKYNYTILGNILDKLSMLANDGCTNGIPIGSAVSDLIAEIIASAIDIKITDKLSERKIDFLGVRFKDDYRFLCQSEDDVKIILASMQEALSDFNLNLNESKTRHIELPEGIYREWPSQYKIYALKKYSTISYRKFEHTILGVLKIDKDSPGTGVIDKFLSELYRKNYKTKLRFLTKKEIKKVISLLLVIKQRRSKAFPMVLAVIKSLLNYYNNEEIKEIIKSYLNNLGKKLSLQLNENAYDFLWLLYFLKFELSQEIDVPDIKNVFIESLIENKQKYFLDDPNISLFNEDAIISENNRLFIHLDIFNKLLTKK